MTQHLNQDPSTFPSRTLLCVTGLFPQIVTETLYALAVQQRPAFVPTEIQVVSTLEGIKRARLMLLSPDQDQFGRLCRDYGIEGIAFDEDRLRVLEGRHGALADIRDEHDNEAAADHLTRLIAGLTSDPRCALHVSIAGGRKTLGFYAGYALSLFGRPQDRLSHVLVNEPFEANPGFFYPPPDGRVLIVDHTRPVSTTEARIDLAMIPFVRLRHGLPPARLGGDLSFSEAVALADGRFGPPRLAIDLAGGHIDCSGRRIALPPMSLAVYAAVARRGKIGAREIEEPGFGAEVLALRALVRRADRWSPRLAKARERVHASIQATTWFREHYGRANSSIKAALGPAASPFLIRGEGRRNRRCYSIAIDAAAVAFRGDI